MNTASDCHVSVISENFFLMRHFWGVTTSFYATTLNVSTFNVSTFNVSTFNVSTFNVTTLNVMTLYMDFLKRKIN